MKQPSWSWSYVNALSSKLELGREFVTTVVDQLKLLSWPEPEIFGIRLALEEAVVNAMKHGNLLDETKLTRINCKISPDRFWIEIEDEGVGFDPQEVPDCTAEENLDKTSGRGLLLMKHYMTCVRYNDSGNKVVMERAISSQETD